MQKVTDKYDQIKKCQEVNKVGGGGGGGFDATAIQFLQFVKVKFLPITGHEDE